MVAGQTQSKLLPVTLPAAPNPLTARDRLFAKQWGRVRFVWPTRRFALARATAPTLARPSQAFTHHFASHTNPLNAGD